MVRHAPRRVQRACRAAAVCSRGVESQLSVRTSACRTTWSARRTPIEAIRRARGIEAELAEKRRLRELPMAIARERHNRS